MGRKVWITRTAAGGQTAARRVRELGFEPVAAPLLTVRPVGAGPIDLTGVGALAFTSVNGVEAFAARSGERGLPVFVVGPATETAARASGFTRLTAAKGDVTALAKVISGRWRGRGGVLLHPCATELAGNLSPEGVSVRRLTVYETIAAPLSPAMASAIPELHAVLVYSAKAARILAQHLHARPAPRPRLLCLSRAVAHALGEVEAAEISVAALPNEEALLNLLVD